MKKLISFVLVFCLLTGALGGGAFAAEKGFSDVAEGQWFYEPIMASAGAGLVSGNPDGSYLPHKELSWAETVVFAVRLDQYLKGEHIYGAEDQTDVWYEIYVDYAFENGFVYNYPDKPNMDITRGEAADIFARVLVQDTIIVVNDPEPDHFSDVPVDHPYNYGVILLAQAGIANGVSEGVFGVDNTLKRSEVATLVARMAGLAEKVIIESAQHHSPYYIEGLSYEQVLAYFAEVGLDTEFGDKNAGQYVRKWARPIYYKVFGTPAETDIAKLEAFTAQLNTIPGFPGIYPADGSHAMNLDIHFCPEDEIVGLMGDDFVNSWGAVSFWFDGDYRIYDETIAIATDIPQYARESIILEEIYNGLGLVQDTIERYDSIIYQWSNSNMEMSEVDELLLTLLYDESIRPGMNYDECAEALALLYY